MSNNAVNTEYRDLELKLMCATQINLLDIISFDRKDHAHMALQQLLKYRSECSKDYRNGKHTDEIKKHVVEYCRTM